MVPTICASLYGDMMPCILVDRYCCYGGTCCLNVWVRRHEFNRANCRHVVTPMFMWHAPKILQRLES